MPVLYLGGDQSLGDDQSVLDVRYGGFTSAGTKPKNEDAFAAHQGSKSSRFYKGAAICIADGVSCSENAELASNTAVTTFIQDYYSTPDSWPVKQSAARVLLSLNSWLFHHGQQGSLRHNTLVTTFSSVIFKSVTAHIFHVGDSRIYRIREGAIEQLTRDHAHKQGWEKSFLTRALGMDSHLEVDYIQEDLQQNDLFLLSTDGVHEFLTDKEMTDILSECSTPTATDSTANSDFQKKQDQILLEKVAAKLGSEALRKGSDDNISCLLARINNLPVEDIDEVHRKLTQQKIPPVMAPGQRIDGYEILKVLHSGTRSHVYLVKHADMSQKLVLKAPSLNFAEDAQYLEGFIREQWVGRRISHQSIMKIYACPENSPFLYHLCEYIEGTTLRQWMVDHPQAPLQQVREITKGIISGLRALQRQGMVHRDLKPENVLLDKTGRVRLIDFGTVQVNGLEEIRSLMSEDVPVGSVDYIAPEYLQGGRGEHCSDIFSLGIMIFEMCTGQLPFKTTSVQQAQPLKRQQWDYISARKYRPQIPVWFDQALKKACEYHPARRYQALSELLQDLTVPNERLVSKHQSSPLMERNPLVFWQVVSALLFIIVFVEAILLTGKG